MPEVTTNVVLPPDPALSDARLPASAPASPPALPAPASPFPADFDQARRNLKEVAGLLKADADELGRLVTTLKMADVAQPLVDKTTRLAAATQALAVSLNDFVLYWDAAVDDNPRDVTVLAPKVPQIVF